MTARPITPADRRPLSVIAREIRELWQPPNYAAAPYLGAMLDLDKIADAYGSDSAQSVVLYFLSNASTWRGKGAKRIKEELRSMLRANGYKIK
jgi:hypothetical protein